MQILARALLVFVTDYRCTKYDTGYLLWTVLDIYFNSDFLSRSNTRARSVDDDGNGKTTENK